MKQGAFNVMIDSAWGSSGKGKVASTLAKIYNITDASTCNMPNAGHTVQVGGERTVYKVLPAASHFGARAWLGPGTVIDEKQLAKEIAFGRASRIYTHARAGVLQEKHAATEREQLSVISSTMQGSGACLAEKVMRKAELWGDRRPLAAFTPQEFRQQYHAAMQKGTMLHEVAQGWGLSLDHGTHYPHCTSRNCGVGRAIDDMAIPHTAMGDIYAVVRTYPIRVGNTADGHSGGWMAGQTELSWDDIERSTGLTGLADKEKTTVTKRVRRVASFSYELLKDCVRYNGVNKIWVTFAEYLNKDALGVVRWGKLPSEVLKFVNDVEDATGVEVCGVSTGPDVDDYCIPPGSEP